MSDKVKITSYAEYRIHILIPELRVDRTFSNYGQTYLFDSATVEEMFYYPAVKGYFTKGLLKIEDKDLRIKLELEEANGEVAQDVIAPISDSTILAHLRVKPLAEFKEFVEELPIEQQNRFVDLAIRNKITDYEKITFLKKLTGKDVMKIIELTTEDEDEE